MARRKTDQAINRAKAELNYRARLLLRNAEFQKDVARLRSEYPHNWSQISREFVDKWHVSYMAFEQLYQRHRNVPDLGPSTVHQYEELFDPTEAGFTLSGAVYVWDPYYDYEVAIPADGEGGGTYGPTPGTQPDTKLCIVVDLSYPLDILTAIIGSHVREAKSKQDAIYGQEEKRRPPRLNLKAVEKQLSVFDLARKGATISSVCQRLHMKPSTVRSDYLAACYKIGVEASKWRSLELAPVSFSDCSDPTCRSAQHRYDGLSDFDALKDSLCHIHRAFLEDVAPSTREYIAPDLNALEHAQARKKTGRRRPSPFDASAE